MSDRDLIAKADKWLQDFGGGYQDYPGGPLLKYEGTELIRELRDSIADRHQHDDEREDHSPALIELVRSGGLLTLRGVVEALQRSGTSAVEASEALLEAIADGAISVGENYVLSAVTLEPVHRMVSGGSAYVVNVVRDLRDAANGA